MSVHDSSPPFPTDELVALLQDATVSPEAIIEEMQFAEAQPYPAEVLAAARKVILSFDESVIPVFEGLPQDLRSLLTEQAIQVRAIDFLNALSLSKDKAIAKESKRALHLLKARGVVFEAAKPVGAPVAPPPFTSEELPTFMSSVDGYGERVVFFSAHVKGGIDVAQVVLSDEQGIVSAHLAQLSRKEYRRFVQGLTKTRTGILSEVPKAYARGLVTLALDLNARARKAVPPAFNDIAFILGPAVPPQVSPGHQLPLPENQSEALHRAPELLEIEVLRSWMPPEDVLRAVELRLEETDVSPIFIDETQRDSARRDVIHKAVLEYWNTEHRRLWAERLFDTAYLLHSEGRKDEAAAALATAHALETGAPAEGIPFCYVFFEQALESEHRPGERLGPPEHVSPGGIILPT